MAMINLHHEMYTVKRYNDSSIITCQKIKLNDKYERTIFIYDYKNRLGHDLVYTYDSRLIMLFEGECFY